MSFVNRPDTRRLIPRWRSFETTVVTGELRSVGRSRPKDNGLDTSEHTLTVLQREWEINRTLPYAGDLVGAALVSMRPECAQEAAEFILSSEDSPPILLRIAGRLLGRPGTTPEPAPDVRVEIEIHNLRRKLRRDPRNAIGWVDLARCYTMLGMSGRATRMMEIALGIAGSNRFVLRSAARLYIHGGEPDRAFALLAANPRTAADPWLLASEVAVADLAGKTSRRLKAGEQMADNTSYSASELTELTGALGTIEIEHGNRKRANRRFKQSLQCPNDNSLAQAEWAAARLTSIHIEPGAMAIPLSFEAQARHANASANWHAGLEHSRQWQRDEPFSVAPAFMGGQAATVLGDNGALADMSMRAMRSWSAEQSELWSMLANNCAVGLAKSGNVNGAEEQFRQIHRAEASPRAQIFYTATEGLLAFRRGAAEDGRKLYRDAVTKAERDGDEFLRATALIYLAEEERHARSGLFDGAITAATEAVRRARSSDPYLSALLDRVARPGP